MRVPIEGEFAKVPIDLVLDPQGMQPGWYYSLPITEDLKVHRDEIALAGPYPSKFAACIKAMEFITDAITDHTSDAEQKPRFGVFLNPDPNFTPRDPGDDMA